eukprot:TRINITY_DN20756_c0_g1_i1.p1 TRINITY_DN20756_c0_g1~~TRINITY_DN20756_c0_g1_i1.p1  ORF type:complete len:175 (+),score=42.56 TRINITY_DN20756_c0_g1_i1:123-647(+)
MNSYLELTILDNRRLLTVAELQHQFKRSARDVCDELLSFAETHEDACRLHYSEITGEGHNMAWTVKGYRSGDRPRGATVTLYALSSGNWVDDDQRTILPSGGYPPVAEPRLSLPPYFAVDPLRCPTDSTKKKRSLNQRHPRKVVKKQQQKQHQPECVEVLSTQEDDGDDPIIIE